MYHCLIAHLCTHDSSITSLDCIYLMECSLSALVSFLQVSVTPAHVVNCALLLQYHKFPSMRLSAAPHSTEQRHHYLSSLSSKAIHPQIYLSSRYIHKHGHYLGPLDVDEDHLTGSPPLMVYVSVVLSEKPSLP